MEESQRELGREWKGGGDGDEGKRRESRRGKGKKRGGKGNGKGMGISRVAGLPTWELRIRLVFESEKIHAAYCVCHCHSRVTCLLITAVTRYSLGRVSPGRDGFYLPICIGKVIPGGP